MAIYSSIGIQASVGKNGKNNTVDVITVQTRLNELMRYPRKKLTEDGKAGSKTIGMIRDFQKCVLNYRRPDGRVDANGKSHRALNDPASESKWAQMSFVTMPETGPVPVSAPVSAPAVLVNLKFKNKRWKNWPYQDAVKYIKSCVLDDRRAQYNHIKINEEYWIESFWSATFGGTKMPDTAEWDRPLTTLRLVLEWENAGLIRERLKRAVRQYNVLHRKWEKYKRDIEGGAGTAITIMEVTIIAVSGAGAAGVAGKGASVARNLAVGTAFNAFGEGALAVGKNVQLDEEIDYLKLARNIALSAAFSFFAGKASKKILGSLAARLSSTWKVDRGVARILAQSREPDALFKRLLADYITTGGANLAKDSIEAAAKYAKNRNFSRTQFIERVVHEMGQRLTNPTGKQAFQSFVSTYTSQ